MKHHSHFEKAALWEAMQTKALIADLDRIVQILDETITYEEERVGVFDRFQAGYPLQARELTARRDNVLETIAVLEKYLPASAKGAAEQGRSD